VNDELDRHGRSALHYAALSGDVDQTDRLLSGGADPDLPDREGFTPLHFAAQQWLTSVASLLLERGADVDPVNCYGNTPLFVAVGVSAGRGDLIEILRQHGADPLRVNDAGQTPVGLARLIGNFDVARFFGDVPG